jgi:hypothetical protein
VAKNMKRKKKGISVRRVSETTYVKQQGVTIFTLNATEECKG